MRQPLLSDMPHLFLATRNPHKAQELGEILGLDFTVEDLSNHNEIGEIVEDGATFAENARLKAVTVSRSLPGFVVGDDSGLEVDSLGGAPGIHSARYAGAGATDARNRQKLLLEIRRGKVFAEHTARFRCVLSLARAGEELASFDGVVEGTIVDADRGAHGFGYDALFQPNGFSRTFAELSAAEKNEISHRAQAATKMRLFLVRSERRPG